MLVGLALRHLLLIAALAGCSDHASQAAPTASSAAAKQPWSQLAFAKAEHAKPHFTDWIPARVAIDETRASHIGPPVAGRITDVWVERGQSVKAGDKLFAIASGDIAEMGAAHQKALAELATAKSTLARTQALVDAKALPAKELLVAQQAVAEAEVEANNTSQRISSLHMSGNIVTAPRAGAIVDKTIVTGQQVSPSDPPVIAIADLSEVWIVADVLDGELGNLRAGTAAQLRLADDGQVIEGKVDQVGAVVDPDRHTIQVRVKLPNAAGALRPNLHAEMRIFDDDNDIDVPAAAISSDGAKDYVYVKTDGNIAKREVLAGPPENGTRSVHRGIAAGDNLVVRGLALLDNQDFGQ